MHAVDRLSARRTRRAGRRAPGLALVLAACAAGTMHPTATQVAVPRIGPPPEVVWRLAGEGRGRPVTDRDSVYFLSKRHEAIAATVGGTVRWRRTTGEPGDATDGSAIVVAGPLAVAGDYNLVAFDRATGVVRWRFVPSVGYGPGIYLGAGTDRVVLAGSPSGRLYAVRTESGVLEWSVAIGGAVRTAVFQPVTDGCIVAVGYTTFATPQVGGVLLADLVTGREIWRRPFPRAIDPLLGTGFAGGPLLTASAVVASSGDGWVYGFDRADGSILWRLPPVVPSSIPSPVPVTSTAGTADYRPLASAAETLFVGSLYGRVAAYDLSSRRERWMHAIAGGSSVAFGLSADAEAVYVPLVSGQHVALDARTGRERWRTDEPRDDFVWPAAALDERVYLAGGRGGFIALQR